MVFSVDVRGPESIRSSFGFFDYWVIVQYMETLISQWLVANSLYRIYNTLAMSRLEGIWMGYVLGTGVGCFPFEWTFDVL